MLQLSLVCSPSNHWSPVQCGLSFPQQISRARCAGLLSSHPLPILFLCPPLVGWAGLEAWLESCLIMALLLYPSQWGPLSFPKCRWSVLETSGHFHGCFICCSCLLSVYVGRGFLCCPTLPSLPPPALLLLILAFLTVYFEGHNFKLNYILLKSNICFSCFVDCILGTYQRSHYLSKFMMIYI